MTNNSSSLSSVASLDSSKDLFELFDLDKNGKIQRHELIDVLSQCAREIGLELDEYLDQIADAVFSNSQAGEITLDGLYSILKYRPNLVNELDLSSVAGKRNQGNDSIESSNTTTNDERFSSKSNLLHANFTSSTNRLADRWDALLDNSNINFPLIKKLRWEYISNNYVKINFTLSILFVSTLLYLSRIYTFWEHSPFVKIARASGQVLNFFCSIVVLLICRRSISFLRSKGFAKYLPVDDHVYFHRMIGWMILGHSLLHTFGHICNDAILASESNAKYTLFDHLFTNKPNVGWIGGIASLTGWFLLSIIIIMAFAQPFSRRVGKFELFYYTHLLFIPFWILLFVHAPNYWIWFLGPFIIFMLESAIRARNLIRYLSSTDETTILRGVPLPSNVLYLVIKRPANFEYCPGDWIYVLIPGIAKYEWHPFTISSAPEQQGVITLHIRAVGEWTKSLRNYYISQTTRNRLVRFIRSGQFSMSIDCRQPQTIIDLSDQQVLNQGNGSAPSSHKLGSLVRQAMLQSRQQQLPSIPEGEIIEAKSDFSDQHKSDSLSSSSKVSPVIIPNNITNASTKSPNQHKPQQQLVTDNSTGSSNESMVFPKRPLKILIDGPYSSPSAEIFRSEHAVLIATGIGVTPFASILQSIVYHNERRKQKCPSCTHQFLDSRQPLVCKLRKVDFVWINRDQKSFEWFIKLLAELEVSQANLEQNERFLDIHIHLTAIEKSKLKSIGMQLALYLVHEKNQKDLLTGLRTRTKAGRPNWDEFFADIGAQRKGKVCVFFCGRPQLSRELHLRCNKLGFKFRKEIF